MEAIPLPPTDRKATPCAAPAEADVLPGAGARVLRPWRLQHQLRHLPAVDREALHLALAHIGADARRADIDDWRDGDDGD